MSSLRPEVLREIERINAPLRRNAAVEERLPESARGAGYVLLVAREAAHLSQSRLAERIGSSQSAMARIESGVTVPSVRTLTRISEACGYRLVLGLRRAKAHPLDRDVLDGFKLLGTLRTGNDGWIRIGIMREPSIFERAGWE